MTTLEHRILNVVKEIPKGRVSTYKLIAKKLGNEGLARVVGNTMAKHPYLGEVPCHRVVKSTGQLGNYQLGVAKKADLLHNEGIPVNNGRVANFRDFLYFNK